MKVLKLIVIGIVIFFVSSVQAQVAVSVTIGSPPPWGPAGYNGVHFYYLPDVEAYYDVQSSLFIYFEGGVWVHRSYLPARHRSYDLYGGYKVVMTDYHGNTPYVYFKEHRTKYARGYHGRPQKTIGERPGRGNHSEKNSHQNNHGNKGDGPGNGKSVGHGNNKDDYQGNGKNMKKDHGNDGGKGKKK